MKFRKIASLGATAALAVGGFVLSSPANAADGEWPADIEEACRLQGHSGACLNAPSGAGCFLT